MPPHTNMVTTEGSQTGQDRRICRVCRQTKALSEFSLKNGRPRRVCKLCRMTRTVRQRDENRKRQIKRCFLALGREVRRGRGNHKRAAELLDQLQELCGGNLRMVAEKWAEFLSETAEQRPATPRVLKGLVTVAEVLRLARQAPAPSRTSSTERQSGPANTEARPAERPPDFSTWTDEALGAAIEQYRRETDAKHERLGRGAGGPARRSSRAPSTE